jgi:hypothetical protein
VFPELLTPGATGWDRNDETEHPSHCDRSRDAQNSVSVRAFKFSAEALSRAQTELCDQACRRVPGKKSPFDPRATAPISARDDPELGVCKARVRERLGWQSESPAMSSQMDGQVDRLFESAVE